MTGWTAQNMRAIALAEQIKQERANLKREVAALPYEESLFVIADLLEHAPPVVARMPVTELLWWAKHMRTRMAEELLADVGGAGTGRLVGELGVLEASVIASRLREWKA